MVFKTLPCRYLNVKQGYLPRCYNTFVRRIDFILSGLLIILPVILVGFVQTWPVPVAVRQANAAAQSAASDDALAISDLQLLLEYQPWRNDLWERLGRAYLNAARYTDALTSFQQAEDTGDLTSQGKIAWADALISSGEQQKAKQLLRAEGEMQSELFSFLQVTALQRRIGDVYGAEATLLRAHQYFPNNNEVNFQLGLLLATTQPESAIQFLQKAQGLESNDMLLKNALITTIENTQELASFSERYLMIGQVFANFSAWDVAAEAFRSALAGNSESALSWAYLAEAEQQMGQDASQAISRALELAPDNEIVNGLSGLYYRRQGKFDLSLVYLDRAVALQPTASVWLTEKGRTYEAMGDMENAYRWLGAATDLAPQDAAAWQALAVFSFTYNYDVIEGGLPAARKALALQPSSPVLADLLGAGLMLVGDYDSAERFFLQADALDPHQSAILIHLGQLKLLQGEYAQARDYLQQAVNYAPSNRLRDLALQLLERANGR
jgi:tetratricopeptide (TPR) repeat protein